jgi:hypothetical protein
MPGRTIGRFLVIVVIAAMILGLVLSGITAAPAS